MIVLLFDDRNEKLQFTYIVLISKEETHTKMWEKLVDTKNKNKYTYYVWKDLEEAEWWKTNILQSYEWIESFTLNKN